MTIRFFRRLPALCMLMFAALLGACATPYRPAVVVRDSTPFPGIAALAAASDGRGLDLILVHGICTKDAGWAERSIARITAVLTGQTTTASPTPAAAASADNGIELVERQVQVGGATLRFHALIWSPLTAPLKRQLDYDNTAQPTDCASDQVCKPVRAKLNGMAKDKLLNDCLADAVIYEGSSHAAIRDAMVETVSSILAAYPDPDSTLVVVAESLGSKMLFDALASMLESERPRTLALGQLAARRLGVIYMAANQLPILGLAAQTPVALVMPAQDALQRLLELRRRQPNGRAQRLQRLAVVAFTDPNDVLSYRLLPARYAGPDVAVADVLVSNDRTWLGLLENPLTAHLDYLANPDVGEMIACGFPRVGCQ